MRARFACSLRFARCGPAGCATSILSPATLHWHSAPAPEGAGASSATSDSFPPKPMHMRGRPAAPLALHQPGDLASAGRGEAHLPCLLHWPHKLTAALALCLRTRPTHPPPLARRRWAMPAAYPKAWRYGATIAFFVTFHLQDLGWGPAFKRAAATRFRRISPFHAASPGYTCFFALHWAWNFWKTGGAKEDPRRLPNMPDELAINVGKLLYEGCDLEVEEIIAFLKQARRAFVDRLRHSRHGRMRWALPPGQLHSTRG